MYKLIVDNIVVDVVKKLRYVRYIPELNKVIITSSASAQGICGSDNKTFYALPNVKLPQEKSYWKVAIAVEICETEYNELRAALKINNVIVPDYLLNIERTRKISELSLDCNNKIISGFTCVLLDKKSHHFRLTIEDQLNMFDIQKEFDAGVEQIIFHATNELCKAYNREDIQTILTAATEHKRYETTYFNLLKYCINNIYNIEEINNIEYGVDLLTLDISDEIKEEVKEKLSWLKL